MGGYLRGACSVWFGVILEAKRFEILNSLPAYGPLYVPISESGELFFSEGFIVRFLKKDASKWVANFKPVTVMSCKTRLTSQ